MEPRKRIRWAEQRNIGGVCHECVKIISDLTPNGWEFAEADALGSTWYPVSATKDLIDRAIEELNKQQPDAKR